MIRWCAYCQRFQGEAPPFEKKLVTHGMCPDCARIGLSWSYEQDKRIKRLSSLNRRFWQAGFSGDAQEIATLADEGIQLGVRPIDMLFGFAGPALIRIGELWECGDISVDDEQRFTATCESLVDLIEDRVRKSALSATRENQGKVLLTSVPGNEHTLGLRFVGIGLLSLGLQTTQLLAGLPPHELLKRTLDGGYEILGLSIAMESQTAALQDTIDAFLSEPAFKGRIVVGGGAINNGLTLSVDPVRVRLAAGLSFEDADRALFLSAS